MNNVNADRARKLAQLYLTPRYRLLDLYEKYVEGTQYEGRRPFMATGDNEPPLLERAPNIVYPIVANAISSLTDFVLGEGRWPAVSSFSSEDDRLFDPEYGLSEDDSDVLDRFISKVVEQSRLKS